MRDVGRKLRVLLIVGGWLLAVPWATLAIRITWESTFLTWEEGPQMVGFALAHSYGILLLPAAIGTLAWLVWAFLYMVKKRSFGGRPVVAIFVAFALCWTILSVPYGFWQYAFAEKLAVTPHAGKFLSHAVGTEDVRTLKALLAHSVSVESENAHGETSIHVAARGGNLEITRLLIEMGANVNSINAYGDSPLQDAISSRHDKIVALLEKHGAILVRGTAEQRDLATQEFVRKQIEELDRKMQSLPREDE